MQNYTNPFRPAKVTPVLLSVQLLVVFGSTQQLMRWVTEFGWVCDCPAGLFEHNVISQSFITHQMTAILHSTHNVEFDETPRKWEWDVQVDLSSWTPRNSNCPALKGDQWWPYWNQRLGIGYDHHPKGTILVDQCGSPLGFSVCKSDLMYRQHHHALNSSSSSLYTGRSGCLMETFTAGAYKW